MVGARQFTPLGLGTLTKEPRGQHVPHRDPEFTTASAPKASLVMRRTLILCSGARFVESEAN